MLLFLIMCRSLVGVWIEIKKGKGKTVWIIVAPSWECGLKFYTILTSRRITNVAPSWECGLKLKKAKEKLFGSLSLPRGSVD